MVESTSTFNLSEIFASIQGEGRFLGVPSIFIRSSGCNLRCQWDETRCDTAYASWNAEDHPCSLSHITGRVEQLLADTPSIRHVVITGGEPTLQPALASLVTKLKATTGLFSTLETNGTAAVDVQTDFVSISPKLASSTPHGCEFAEDHDKARINVDALTTWIKNCDHQLKFVIQHEADEDEICSILEQLPPVDPENIHLMPQGVAYPQLQSKAKLCVEIALRRGWRYTPRAHIEIFGNERGK